MAAVSKPVIDQRAAEQMNLNVLKRMDPQVEEVRGVLWTGLEGLGTPSMSELWLAETPYRGDHAGGGGAARPLDRAPCCRRLLLLQLLATAGHVALYDFDIPTKRWVRVRVCVCVCVCIMPPLARVFRADGCHCFTYQLERLVRLFRFRCCPTGRLAVCRAARTSRARCSW